MNIDVISDLHGFYPNLEGGDLLLIAGDLTGRDAYHQYEEFFAWCSELDYQKIVLIGGNHDNVLAMKGELESGHPPVIAELMNSNKMTYLCDSGTEFGGLKIWGSPWTLNFHGQNPHAKAFGLNLPSQMMEKFQAIPADTDILITHSPPHGILDQCSNLCRVGCKELLRTVSRIRPKLHVFGHIHEAHGRTEMNDTIYVNASRVNEYYEPVNAPVRIEF